MLLRLSNARIFDAIFLGIFVAPFALFVLLSSCGRGEGNRYFRAVKISSALIILFSSSFNFSMAVDYCLAARRKPIFISYI